MTTIKERVIQILENKNIPKETFFEKIDVTSANFRGKARSTPLLSSTIENIISEIPDISIDWLITGKGQMLRDEHQESSLITNICSETILSQQKTIEKQADIIAKLIEKS